MKFTRMTQITMAILTILFGGSLWTILSPCHAVSDTKDVPDFIEEVWPPPKVAIGAGCFVKRRLQAYPLGVGVKIKTEIQSISDFEIHQTGKTETVPLSKRISLYIDGDQIPVDIVWEMGEHWFIIIDNEYIELPKEIFVGSNDSLPLGDHTAKVVITTRSGKNLEYEWEFRIRAFP